MDPTAPVPTPLIQRGWSHLPRSLWSFNSGERREQYLAILACFDANAFEPALNMERIAAVVADDAPELADDAALDSALDQLANNWQLLTESRDETASYRNPAEFRRRTRQWQLTRDGQAVIATLNGAVQARRDYAALQPAAIDDLAAALREAVEQAALDDADTAIVHSRLSEGIRIHTMLVENLRTFMQDVNRFLTGVDSNDEAVYEAKQAILTYLQQFVVDAERPAMVVRKWCDRMRRIGVSRVVTLAVDGANLAPPITGEDPRIAATERFTKEVEGICDWFATDGARTFDTMLPLGREAINKLLRILELRRDQRQRASRLPDDFRTLARIMSGAADDETAAAIIQAATGLRSSRHFTDPVADDPVSSLPATENPGVDVTVELRRRPRSTGRPKADRPVVDRRALRRQRQQELAAEMAAQRNRRLQLACPPGTRISSRPDLDHETFRYFLTLLASALFSPAGRHDTRRATSSDGTVIITLTPPDDGRTATVTTPDGTFTGPDYHLAIAVTDAAVEPAGKAAGR